MLDPNVAKKPAGVLSLANTLAQERFNGAPLRTLETRYQQDMVVEAEAMLERYVVSGYMAIAIPHQAPCDDRREVRPSYDDLLYDAMQKLQRASDHRSQFGTRKQDEAFRNSLLNDVKELISEAQERI